MIPRSSLRRFGFALPAALMLAACAGEEVAPGLSPLSPANIGTGPAPVRNLIVLCKNGSGATFDVTFGSNPTTSASLTDGECQTVVTYAGGFRAWTAVSELVPANTTLDSIVVETVYGCTAASCTLTYDRTVLTGTTAAGAWVGLEFGAVITYYNTFAPPPPPPPSAEGRMTGGGRQIDANGIAITRGFTIHCDIVLSNNLEINWPGNKWHIDKPLTSAYCVDDPAIAPAPPKAPFDTFHGEGIGRLNGVDGAKVKFIFVDAGEPGRNDQAQIQIWDPNGNLVLDVPLRYLDNGNIQAHYDQPHKNK